eukprot:EG_transcript_45
MALLERQIIAELSACTRPPDPARLQVAFRQLTANLEGATLLGLPRVHGVSHDLYLFCAEAAVALREWDVAQHCVLQLAERAPTRTDFVVRFQYAAAQVTSHLAAPLKGRELVARVQEALAKVIRGIGLATQDPARHAYLVSHGAAVYWNIGRQLYRPGLHADLLPSLPAAVKALEVIEFADHNARVLWYVRLAVCFSLSGRHPEATATLQKAADYVARFLPTMRSNLHRVLVAFTKYAPNPKVRTDASTSILKGIVGVQLVAAGVVADAVGKERELTDAYKALMADFHDPKASPKPPALPPPKPAAKGAAALPATVAKGAPAVDRTKEAATLEQREREEVIAEVGLQAALHGLPTLAEDADRVAGHSKSLKARVLSECIRAVLQAQQCGGWALVHERFYNHTPGDSNATATAGLLHAVKKVEKAVDSAVRSGDSTLIHTACILIWNLSLPLLQPELRKQLRKPFATALGALDAIHSSYNALKAQLFLEIAKCDVAEELLTKASAGLQEALRLDYVVPEEERVAAGYERPLDRHLVPLKNKCELISNIYVLPEGPEDEATLVLEQAKDNTNPALRLSLLERAVKLLEVDESPVVVAAADPTPEPEADSKTKRAPKKGAKKEEEEPREEALEPQALDDTAEAARRRRAALWAVVVSIGAAAKSEKFVAVVRQAAAFLLRQHFPRPSDRDLRTEQALACYAVAESHVWPLEKKGLWLGFRQQFDPMAAGDPGAQKASCDASNRAMHETDREVCSSLVRGIKIGLELVAHGYPDHWLVQNGVTHFWNWHRRMFEAGDYLPVREAAAFCYQTLIAMVDLRDGQLFTGIAVAYLRALLQCYVRRVTPPSVPDGDIIRVNLSTFERTESNATELKQAEEVCEKVISLLKPMDAKQFHLLATNVRRLLGRQPDLKGGPQERVLAYLELLAQPSPPDVVTYVSEALLALSENPNIELTARLAEAALQWPECAKTTVMVCQIGKGLAQRGQLGAKEAEPIPPLYDPLATLPPRAGKGPSKKPDAPASPAAQSPKAEPAATGPKPPATPQHHLWHSKVLYTSAKAILMCIDRRQPKSTQNELRRSALMDLVASIRAAAHAPVEHRAETVEKCLAHFCQACGPFTETPSARAALFPPLSELMAAIPVRLEIGAPVSRHDQLLSLYLALFACLMDRQDYQAGLDQLHQALIQLPRTHHKALFEADIEFRCRLNLNPTTTLSKVKDYDAETQARAWLTLARCAAEAKDQQFAYQRCVEAVHGHPLLQAETLSRFAFWLFTQGHPLQVVMDHLNSAADCLSDMLEVEGEEGDGQSCMSGTGNPSRRTSSAGSSRSAVAKRPAASSTAKSTRSTAAGGRSPAHSAQPATTTAASPSAVKSQTTGESRATCGVRHLELLARIYVMLAALSLTDGTAQQEYLLLAHHYYLQVWRLAATTLNTALAQHEAQQRLAQEKLFAATGGSPVEVPVVPEPEPARAATPATKAKKAPTTKGGKAPAHAAAPSSRPATAEKAPPPPLQPVTLPDALQGWVGFEVAGPVLQLFEWGPATLDGAVNGRTVPAPEFTVAVLRRGVALLEGRGLHCHALPLQCLAQLVLQLCVPQTGLRVQALGHLVDLQLAAQHMRLGAPALAPLYLPAPDQLAVREEDRSDFLEQIKQLQLHPPPPRCEAPHPFAQLFPVDEAFSVRRLWAEQADLLLRMGRLPLARSLFREALLHSRAWQDGATHCRCLYGLARLAHREGRAAEALQLSRECLKVHSEGEVDVDLFLEVLQFRVQLLLEGDTLEPVLGVVEAVHRALQAAREAVTRRRVAPDTEAALVRCLEEAKARFDRQLVAAVLQACGAGPGQSYAALPAVHAQRLWELLGQAMATLKGTPHYVDCLRTEHRRLTFLRSQEACASDDLVALKPQLLQEKELLKEQKVLLEKVLAEDALPVGSLATPVLQIALPAQTALAEVEAELVQNTVALIRVHFLERQLYSMDRMPLPAFPVVEGREALLPQLSEFFRMTDRQRARRDRRRRNQARLERRQQREEQRRAELAHQAELQQQLAEKDKRKDKKPKAPAQQATTPISIAIPMDADSPLSEESGDDWGEEEELEAQRRQAWLATQPAVLAGDPPTLTDALQAAASALSLSAAGPCPVPYKGLMSHCLRMMYEVKQVLEEGRQTLLEPELAPRDNAVQRAWNRPVDMSALPTVVEDPKAKKGKDGKPAPAKGAKGAKAEDEAVEVEDLRLPDPPGDGAALLVPYLHQAVGHLYEGLSHVADLTDYDAAADLALELAKCYVHSSPNLAARWVALAQAYQHGHHSLQQFMATLPGLSREGVLLRQLVRMRRGEPWAAAPEVYDAVKQALQQDSVVYRLLSLPPVSPDPAHVVGLGVSTFGAALPASTVCLVLYYSPKHRHLYAAVLQGPAGFTARAAVDHRRLRRLLGALQQWDKEREGCCAADDAQMAGHLADLEAQFTTELVPEMVALLRPLLDGAVLPALQREPLPSLLLVPSFELHALPLEAYPGLASLPCVTRDFSIHLALQRYSWSQSQPEKFLPPTHLAYVVDPYNEHPPLSALVEGRLPAGPALTLSGAAQQPGVREWQRVLSTAAHMVVFIAGLGRLASCVGLPHLAGLPMSHVRACVLLDRGMNEAAARRQSKSDLAVPEPRRPLEAAPAVANLLLCRGVAGLAVNLHCAPATTTVLISNAVLSSLEKGLPFHTALHEHLRRSHDGPPTTAAAASNAGKAASKKEKSSGDGEVYERLHQLGRADRFNTVIYGVPQY